ncbi:AbiV family abortive infection protein [Cognatilysobacter lacus]|uniref:AbiV family abortive infection protein n=1 Tax=Cognatilysobacter lacus TaxID=1643323 RepID=A0A5D8YI41_9GAMM|nr:AbiV family abortive infection protein [Lysobacter lacus]TZF81966.1 AbiV family abortive infection protein [Lysobacter lacus]
MEAMSVSDLHGLRLAILSNAIELTDEAEILVAHQRWARAFLLAHFAIEEMGKIPMVVGIIGRIMKGEPVDWRKTRRRLSDHKAKISSQNMHFYMFGLDIDLLRDSDLEWLKDADGRVGDSYQFKNAATYVDSRENSPSTPATAITQDMAEHLVAFAGRCVQSHLISERLTNPAYPK